MSEFDPCLAFARLRALMNIDVLDESQSTELNDLLNLANQSDPVVYQEQWVPYIHGFPHHFHEFFGKQTPSVPPGFSCDGEEG